MCLHDGYDSWVINDVMTVLDCMMITFFYTCHGDNKRCGNVIIPILQYCGDVLFTI